MTFHCRASGPGLTFRRRVMSAKRQPPKLPPAVEREVRRVLARAARRLLAKRLREAER